MMKRKRKTHWIERAERVSDGDPRILGETPDGYIVVPQRRSGVKWMVRYNWQNPRHWSYWLRSRRTGRIAFLDGLETNRRRLLRELTQTSQEDSRDGYF